MNLKEEELKLFNFVLQFDFSEGDTEYSCEDLKAADLTVEHVLGCLKFIICGYNDGKQNCIAFLDIDEEGGVGYNFFWMSAKSLWKWKMQKSLQPISMLL